jgi:twitching motility protein PilT
MLDLDGLLRFMVEQRGSDLHLKVGSAPHVRIDGHLTVLDHEPVSLADTNRIAGEIIPPDRAEEIANVGEADFALSVSRLGRFRVHVFRQRGSMGMVFRRVVPGLPSFETLGLPQSVPGLAEETRGLVLVTGPAGSGRTTTLAAMIDHINQTRSVNIVTIEDPIEVLHPDKMAIVNQREVGTDTDSYANALRRVVRQDPDVIAIGEIASADTMWAALSAASTGHLVLSTMATVKVAETLERVIDFFPPYQHRQVRLTLASCLKGVVCLKLLEREDGRGRVPAVEVLTATGRVFDHIMNADATPAQLEAIMAEGEYSGMQTFDQSLYRLCRDGQVSMRDAMAAATDPEEFRISLATAGLISA